MRNTVAYLSFWQSKFLDCTTIPVMLTLLFEVVRQAPTLATQVTPKCMWRGSNPYLRVD
jgi:hypothetical protein